MGVALVIPIGEAQMAIKSAAKENKKRLSKLE